MLERKEESWYSALLLGMAGLALFGDTGVTDGRLYGWIFLAAALPIFGWAARLQKKAGAAVVAALSVTPTLGLIVDAVSGSLNAPALLTSVPVAAAGLILSVWTTYQMATASSPPGRTFTLNRPDDEDSSS